MNKKTILACLALGGFVLCGCAKAEPKKTYTVIWKDENGNVLETDSAVEEGTTPTYDSAMPTKTPTVDKEYSFNGWSPAVAPVTADVVYTATFQEGVRKYTVTWKSDENTVIKTEKVAYNTTPVYSGATPTKASTAEHTYTYNGSWDPAPAALSGDATYVAQYDEDVHSYHVYFRNEDGSELMDAGVVAYSGIDSAPDSYTGATPEKSSTAQYNYEWDGTWTKNVNVASSEAVFTPNFSSETRKYTVIWKDGNGTVIETDINVLYGSTPSYDGVTPTKNQSATTRYEFNGTWTPAVGDVQGDVTYVANFNEAGSALYTAKFVNWNDTLLETHSNVEYDDEEAVNLYEGATPTCTENPGQNYAFDGFIEQDIDTVNFIRTFKAQFHPTSSKPEYLTYIYDAVKEEYSISGFAASDIPYLTLPSVYDDGAHGEHPVVAINDMAFYNRPVEYVHIPASIKYIGEHAFGYCNDLERVVIEGNPDLDNYSFYWCPKLSNFTMNGENTYTIGNSVFMNCPMTNYTLGPKVTSIGQYAFKACQFTSFGPYNYLGSIGARAFENCSQLANLDLGSSLESISYYAFNNCSSLTNVVIPDTVTSMDSGGVFYNCGELQLFKLGAAMTYFNMGYLGGNTRVAAYDVSSSSTSFSIRNGALYNFEGTRLISVPSLTSGTYVIEDGTEEIAQMAFAYTENLERIDFCEGIIHLPSQAFYVCGATVINLPESLKTIDDHCFTNSEVTSIYIPKGVTSINSSAFVDADQIQSITIDPDNSKYVAEDLVVYSKDYETLKFVLQCKTGSYTTHDDVETIDEYAFYSTSLSHVKIKDKVTSIGYHCFANYGGTIELGTGIDEIPQYCFEYSTFESITLPSSITVIGMRAFQYADITSISLPDACVEIQQEAFYNCDAMESITLNKVQTLGYRCFEYSGITSLALPSTVTTISNGTFSTCRNLVTLDMSAASFTVVPEWLCVICDNLETVTLPAGITQIKEHAFDRCLKLATFNWSALTSLSIIDEEAFNRCDLMSSIILPASLTSIGYHAFSFVGATTFEYAGTQSNWENATFKSNRNANWTDWPSEAGIKSVHTSDSATLDLYETANR